jgi:endonuclease G
MGLSEIDILKLLSLNGIGPVGASKVIKRLHEYDAYDDSAIIKAFSELSEFTYCEEYELPYFVKYTINKEDVFGLEDRDYSKWKSDPLVDTKTASNSDYVRSGYDRGHLKPAAVSKTTQDHMNQSHLFSNCSPQIPAFNRGGLRSVEGTVRHIVGEGIQDSVIVYTGPILKGITDYIGSINKIER